MGATEGVAMRFWLYTVRAMWRVITGRWFVWRDAPTDVVRKAASLWFSMRKDTKQDVGVTDLVTQARAEAKLRKKNSYDK